MKIRGTTVTTPIKREVVVDDTTICKKPWSSMNTVDRLCPSFTEQGTIVSCEPLESYPLHVVGSINAVQSGSGDPSPENVRPINGWDAMTVTHTGKNLFDFKGEMSKIVGMVNADGGNMDGNNYWGFTVHLPVGTYTISAEGDPNPPQSEYLYAKINNNGNHVENLTIIKGTTITPQTFNINAGDVIYIYNGAIGRDYEKASSLFEYYDIMLVSGSAKADYEPYRGSTITIDFNGRTVYGGIYDILSGWVISEFGINKVSDFTWVIENGAFKTSGLRGKAVFSTNGTPPIGICSHYKGVKFGDFGNSDDAYALGCNGNEEWRIKDTSFSTVEDFVANMGECQILYQRKDPEYFWLTPQALFALNGENVLGCNTGDITVAGKKDLAKIVTDLVATVSAITGV